MDLRTQVLSGQLSLLDDFQKSLSEVLGEVADNAQLHLDEVKMKNVISEFRWIHENVTRCHRRILHGSFANFQQLKKKFMKLMAESRYSNDVKNGIYTEASLTFAMFCSDEGREENSDDNVVYEEKYETWGTLIQDFTNFKIVKNFWFIGCLVLGYNTLNDPVFKTLFMPYESLQKSKARAKVRREIREAEKKKLAEAAKKKQSEVVEPQPSTSKSTAKTAKASSKKTAAQQKVASNGSGSGSGKRPRKRKGEIGTGGPGFDPEGMEPSSHSIDNSTESVGGGDNVLIEENPTVSDQDTTGQDTSDYTDGSHVSPPSASSDTVQKKNLRKRKVSSEDSDGSTPHKMNRA